jgi:cysteine-rich repeat protein
MLRLGFRPTSRFALGLATFLVGAVGCTAGVQQTTPTGGAAGTSASGSAGAGGSATGLGGFNVGGRGGSATTGTGGTLPVPPGCGDGINNQGGIEACDDGNTVAGDGCNGVCKVEPNWN